MYAFLSPSLRYNAFFIALQYRKGRILYFSALFEIGSARLGELPRRSEVASPISSSHSPHCVIESICFHLLTAAQFILHFHHVYN